MQVSQECLETRPKGVETRVQVSHDFHPSGTDGDGRRAVVRLHRRRRQHGWTCAQLSIFVAQTDQETQYVCASLFSARKFRYVHDRQQIVILGVSIRIRRKRQKMKKKRKNKKTKKKVQICNSRNFWRTHFFKLISSVRILSVKFLLTTCLN